MDSVGFIRCRLVLYPLKEVSRMMLRTLTVQYIYPIAKFELISDILIAVPRQNSIAQPFSMVSGGLPNRVALHKLPSATNCGMFRTLRLLFGLIVSCVSSRQNLLLESLALCQQLSVLKIRHPQPRFPAPDKIFWIMLRKFWSGWQRSLILCATQNGCRLASSWLPPVLALALTPSGAGR